MHLHADDQHVMYYACALFGGKSVSERMARRQKRKAHDTVSSEQATVTDFSPSQTPGLKYVPKFKKARLKATEDVAQVIKPFFMAPYSFLTILFFSTSKMHRLAPTLTLTLKIRIRQQLKSL